MTHEQMTDELKELGLNDGATRWVIDELSAGRIPNYENYRFFLRVDRRRYQALNTEHENYGVQAEEIELHPELVAESDTIVAAIRELRGEAKRTYRAQIEAQAARVKHMDTTTPAERAAAAQYYEMFARALRLTSLENDSTNWTARHAR